MKGKKDIKEQVEAELESLEKNTGISTIKTIL